MTTSAIDQLTPTEIHDGENAGLAAGAVLVSEPYSWPMCQFPGCSEPADPWGDHRREAHRGAVVDGRDANGASALCRTEPCQGCQTGDGCYRD